MTDAEIELSRAQGGAWWGQQATPETKRQYGQNLPQSHPKRANLLTSCFQTSELQDYKRKNFCYFKLLKKPIEANMLTATSLKFLISVTCVLESSCSTMFQFLPVAFCWIFFFLTNFQLHSPRGFSCFKCSVPRVHLCLKLTSLGGKCAWFLSLC
jgi:hypothetical protein